MANLRFSSAQFRFESKKPRKFYSVSVNVVSPDWIIVIDETTSRLHSVKMNGANKKITPRLALARVRQAIAKWELQDAAEQTQQRETLAKKLSADDLELQRKLGRLPNQQNGLAESLKARRESRRTRGTNTPKKNSE